MWVQRLLSEVIQPKSVGVFGIDFTHQEILYMSVLEATSYLGVKAVWKTLSQIYLAKIVKPHTNQ